MKKILSLIPVALTPLTAFSCTVTKKQQPQPQPQPDVPPVKPQPKPEAPQKPKKEINKDITKEDFDRQIHGHQKPKKEINKDIKRSDYLRQIGYYTPYTSSSTQFQKHWDEVANNIFTKSLIDEDKEFKLKDLQKSKYDEIVVKTKELITKKQSDIKLFYSTEFINNKNIQQLTSSIETYNEEFFKDGKKTLEEFKDHLAKIDKYFAKVRLLVLWYSDVAEFGDKFALQSTGKYAHKDDVKKLIGQKNDEYFKKLIEYRKNALQTLETKIAFTEWNKNPKDKFYELISNEELKKMHNYNITLSQIDAITKNLAKGQFILHLDTSVLDPSKYTENQIKEAIKNKTNNTDLWNTINKAFYAVYSYEENGQTKEKRIYSLFDKEGKDRYINLPDGNGWIEYLGIVDKDNKIKIAVRFKYDNKQKDGFYLATDRFYRQTLQNVTWKPESGSKK